MTTIRTIDLETTGLEPPAEVCDVGLCDYVLDSNSVAAPVSWLCGVREMPPEARAVHHISMADLDGVMLFDPASIPLDCDAFAAHNAEFELKWFAPPLPMICTYKAALRVWPGAPSHGNFALYYWLEDQGKVAALDSTLLPHRAGPDAYVTAHILRALFEAGRTGKEMVAWTKEPRLLTKCPIGKFRGKPWAEVEAGFLGWMLRQPDMDADLKWNAEREIDRRQGEF
jgi:exodeoxyribonuclease X